MATIPQEYITTNLNLDTEQLVPGEPPDQFCIKTERKDLKLMGYALARNQVDATVDGKVAQATSAASQAASSASAASTAKTQAQAAATTATQKAQIATDAATTVAQAGQYVETAMQAATTAQSASAQAATANQTALANSQIVMQAAQSAKIYRDEAMTAADEARQQVLDNRFPGRPYAGAYYKNVLATRIYYSSGRVVQQQYASQPDSLERLYSDSVAGKSFYVYLFTGFNEASNRAFPLIDINIWSNYVSPHAIFIRAAKGVYTGHFRGSIVSDQLTGVTDLIDANGYWVIKLPMSSWHLTMMNIDYREMYRVPTTFSPDQFRIIASSNGNITDFLPLMA